MKAGLLFLVLVSNLAANAAVFAADSAKAPDPFAAIKHQVTAGTAENPAAPAQTGSAYAIPVKLEPGDIDQMRKSFVDDYVQRMKHDQRTREFISKSWDWHLYSTAFLFFLVLGIVIFGLYITYLQFNRDYRTWTPPPAPVTPAQGDAGNKPVNAGEDAAAAGGQAGAPPVLNTVKISAGGLELSSQVIGLLVLAISLAFFYLYVMKVYPIQTEELTQIRPRAEGGNDPPGATGKGGVDMKSDGPGK